MVWPAGRFRQTEAIVKDRFFGVLLGAVALLAAAVPLAAHHGAASFDTTKHEGLRQMTHASR
jgi:hypothetical protein